MFLIGGQRGLGPALKVARAPPPTHAPASRHSRQVHERFLKLWAKKVVVSPESAVVPLKDVDAQLASKFDGVSPAYSELLSKVSAGSKTLGQRITESPAFSTFLLRRDAEAAGKCEGGGAEGAWRA